MEIKSEAFNNGGTIPTKYTCEGEDINPPLEITNIPKETESLALIVDDPDAPNRTWVHWLFWNLPVDSNSIEEGIAPSEAVYGKNDFGKLEYGGPCPPSGTHRYYFKAYALDSKLDLKEGSTKEELLSHIKKCKVGESTLMGKYKKKAG
jgi:hypothetical protein